MVHQQREAPVAFVTPQTTNEYHRREKITTIDKYDRRAGKTEEQSAVSPPRTIYEAMSSPAQPARERPESPLQTAMSVVNGLLDLVLKMSALLLALPAVAILTYLRTIHRTDLFLPAVASAPGLFALLEATFILCAALLASFAGPSWLAAQIANTYGKDERPKLGAASFVLLTGFMSGAFFLLLCYLHDSAMPLWLKWIIGIACGLLIPVLLFALAWRSPRGFQMLTSTERTDRKMRTRQSVKRTLWGCASAVIALSTFVTFSYVFQLYGLSGNGWQTWLVGLLVFPASLLPGAMYLARRSWGDSRLAALGTSAMMVALTIFVLLMNGVSPEPLALLTMRAMSIAEKEPRTFELMTHDERSAWQALGFRFIQDSNFFPATIRFQFGDVRLLCVDPYDVASPYPGALEPLSGKLAKSTVPLTGCITPLKEEVRVVEPPATSALLPKIRRELQPAASGSDKPAESERSKAVAARKQN
ncbi:MFS transporter [Paraburkholderia guartelaensis]|uniref:MFS transporter n=2 Tax=Paraburkholderia TaxID=1822464 RepID=A0ABU9SQ70_9BURK